MNVVLSLHIVGTSQGLVFWGKRPTHVGTGGSQTNQTPFPTGVMCVSFRFLSSSRSSVCALSDQSSRSAFTVVSLISTLLTLYCCLVCWEAARKMGPASFK